MANNRHSSARKNGAKSSGTEEKPSVFHHAKAGEKPRSDAGYFELMSFSIFSAAVGKRKTVIEKWPDIVFGFKNFHVQRVSEFAESDLQEVSRRVPIQRLLIDTHRLYLFLDEPFACLFIESG